MSCSSIGCGPPIELTATLRIREAMTATFCKGGTCQSVSFSADGTRTEANTITALFSLEPTDTGVTIGVSVIREATYMDGEPLSFTVTSDTGGELLKWSGPAHYSVRHDVGGPGCGDCSFMEIIVPAT
jgi:hypothetical protein